MGRQADLACLRHTEQRDFYKLLSDIDYSRGTDQVFRDWLQLTCCSLRNLYPWNGWQETEDLYHQVLARYVPADFMAECKALREKEGPQSEAYAQLMQDKRNSKFVQLCELTGIVGQWFGGDHRFDDFLGPMAAATNALNAGSGQFFTPQSVSTMMAKMACGNMHDAVAKQGFVKMMEPACGAGVFVLDFGREMLEQGFDLEFHILCHANDIDPKCCDMTFIQCSLAGIPTVVTCADALMNPTFNSVQAWANSLRAAQWWRGELEETVPDPAQLPPRPTDEQLQEETIAGLGKMIDELVAAPVNQEHLKRKAAREKKRAAKPEPVVVKPGQQTLFG